MAHEQPLASFHDMAETPEDKWDEMPRIGQPDELSIDLFPHQCVSVYWMEKLERVQRVKLDEDAEMLTSFGVLGDVPGYGKSLSVVALLARDRFPWDLDQPLQTKEVVFEVNQGLMLKRRFAAPPALRRVSANLLVASSTLIEQWKQYLAFVKKPGFVVKELSSMAHFDQFDPVLNHYDVVLVSSTRYNQLMDSFPEVVWKRFVFDEAASTHINAMRKVRAGFLWFVTATYNELWHVRGNRTNWMNRFMLQLGQHNHQILNHLVIRNPVGFVQRSFRMPDVRELTHRCLNPRVMNVLSRYLDAESREMISAGDIRGVIDRVGGFTTSASNLYELVGQRLQERLRSAEFSLNMWTNRGPTFTNEIRMWTQRVESLRQSISELKDKYKSVLEEDCTICYSPISRPLLVPCCQNVFCAGCVVRWMESHRTCPMCRSDLAVKDFVYVQSEETDEKNNGDEKTEEKVDVAPERPRQKPEVVARLIREGIPQGRKFLVFSGYDASFERIRSELAVHQIQFVEISGTKSTRDNKLRKFREGKVSVVFLNSRFNGAGINLEMATDIILYHEMPPAIHQQVVGRVLRVGRKDDLRIHQLVFE